jgi:competence protein ComEC
VGGLLVEFLYPTEGVTPSDDANATSVVLRVTFGDFDALLTGDAYTDVERLLADDLPPELELLKVGHHGSDTSTDSLLLARGRPEVALVSAGRFNRYGHPDPGVIARLGRSGASVWRTDTQGTVSVLARRDASYTVSAERRASGPSAR